MNFSSPSSNTVCTLALGVSVHSLKTVSSTQSHFQKKPSPHSVELLFEREIRVAPFANESIHVIGGFGLAKFEPFRVVQNDVIVLRWGESFVDVSMSWPPLCNVSLMNEIWPWLPHRFLQTENTVDQR